jgi:hypothetical protein
MTTDRIASYLDELTRALRARGAYSRQLVREVHDHLLDSVEAGQRRGLTVDAARVEAIANAGTPELVARHAATDVLRLLRGMLLSVCAGTMGSIAYLSLSLLLLRPPRANYRAWSAEASCVFVLTAVTFAWAKAGDLSSPWTRPLLLLGSLALAILGAKTFYANVTGHFEGYGVVLGTLFTLQALLTLVHLRPGLRGFLTHA